MANVKTYRPYAPEQSFLLPPSPREWLPEGHLAYFVLDLVEGLDLGDIERAIQGKDHRGERPFGDGTDHDRRARGGSTRSALAVDENPARAGFFSAPTAEGARPCPT